MFKSYCCFLFVFLLAGVINMLPAQDTCSYTLSGRVIDEHDGQALDLAGIVIHELQIGTTSDSSGAYSIKGICPGTYTVTCSHIGCEPITVKIKIQGNLVYNFYPEHHTELLRSVAIVATRKPGNLSIQGEHSLTEQEMQESTGMPLAERLKNITGVGMLNTGSGISKPVIHGLHSNRLLILNNGVRQEGQQWGNEHAPEIDPLIADELTVVKGANSVLYGPDAIAGVVLVLPKPLQENQDLRGEVNLAGFSNGRQGVTSALLEGSVKKLGGLSWRAQGTLKRGGNVHSPDYHLKNTGLEEKNFSLAAAYKKAHAGVEIFYSQFNTEIGIFSAAHIGNLTDLQNAFEADEPLETSGFSYKIDRPYQQIEHELLKLNGYVHANEKNTLKFIYSRQYNLRREYDKHKPLNDSLANLNLPALQFEITTHNVELIWERKNSKAWKSITGINGTQQENTYEGRFFIPNFLRYAAGVMRIERWEPADSNFELEAGIRYDHIFQEAFLWEDAVIVSPDFSYNNVSGNLGAIYNMNEKLKLRLNAGHSWRPPNMNELFSDGLHHGAAAVEIGDPDLKSERAHNIIAVGEFENESLRIDVELYYNYIVNFIYLKPEEDPTLTIRGAFPTFRHTQIDAALRGLDFRFEYHLTDRLDLTQKASLLRARNQTLNRHLELMPADRFETRLEYKFKNGVKINDAYVSLALENVLKQSRVPADVDFVDPPKGFSLLHLYGGLSLRINNEKVFLGLGINNLLDVRYREYLNRFRYFSDEMGRNITLRVSIPFTIAKNKI